jgi:hypothetical protein
MTSIKRRATAAAVVCNSGDRVAGIRVPIPRPGARQRTRHPEAVRGLQGDLRRQQGPRPHG